MENLKAELGEELEQEENNHLEYDENNLIEKIDDSWIKAEDRIKLLTYFKQLVSIEYPWADKNLEQSLIQKKYYNTIKVMDRTQYEIDISNPVKSVLSLLD